MKPGRLLLLRLVVVCRFTEHDLSLEILILTLHILVLDSLRKAVEKRV